jgi:glycosyltransferase involved in cell wall biosynthesis
MISGNPGITCGIADYTERLVVALSTVAVHSYVPKRSWWGVSASGSLFKEVLEQRADLVHIQYPAAAYGKGLAPQALAVFSRLTRTPVVVTIHEFSQTHPLRQLASTPFAMAKGIIFTNHYERVAFTARVPWFQGQTSIVPVGSSVPFSNGGDHDGFEVIYFGLIRPNKGIEAFLDLATLCHAQDLRFRFTLVGSSQMGEQTYFNAIRERVRALANTTLETDLPSEAVSSRVARARFAYLPFPDGASDRRTSLLAMMGNGLLVLTTRGAHTPPDLEGAVRYVANHEEAFKQLEVLAESAESREALKARARRYLERFSWDSIAKKHLELYSKVMTKGITN